MLWRRSPWSLSCERLGPELPVTAGSVGRRAPSLLSYTCPGGRVTTFAGEVGTEVTHTVGLNPGCVTPEAGFFSPHLLSPFTW